MYVHRAVPIHRCSFSCSLVVGYTRMRLALPGGGFSGVDGFTSFFFLDLFGGAGCFFFALPSVVCRTASVMLCDKDSDDGDEVVRELLLGIASSAIATVLVAENHEFCISLSEDPLDELHAEASEPVEVGHHNLSDAALVDALQ